jgi:hypothetical protein
MLRRRTHRGVHSVNGRRHQPDRGGHKQMLLSLPPHLREVCAILARGLVRLGAADDADAGRILAPPPEPRARGAGSTGLCGRAERVSVTRSGEGALR